MEGFLENAFSSITTSLPLIKISNWAVKVKKERKLKVTSANSISEAIDIIKNDIKWTQEQISGFFQYTDPSMQDIAEFDSFISLNGSHSSQIVKNAIENGSFRSVNKIKEPNRIVIELAKGGYRAGIEEVLANLKKYENSTAICSVITPFGQLNSLNLIGLEYNFTIDNGSNLLVAKLTFQEIVYGSVFNNKRDKKVKLPSFQKLEDMGRKALQAGD